MATKHLSKPSTPQTPFVRRYGGCCGGFPPCRTNERAIEFLKAQGAEVETRDASEVPGVYSALAIKIVGHKVAGFDRVELQHVITAERHKEGLR